MISKSPDNYSLVVTALYDTVSAARRLCQALRQVDRESGEGNLDLRLWRADLLRQPEAFAQARDDAAESVLVALALGSARTDLAPVQALLREWARLPRKGPAGLIVHLCPGSESPGFGELCALADRLGIELVVHRPESAPRAVPPPSHSHRLAPAPDLGNSRLRLDSLTSLDRW